MSADDRSLFRWIERWYDGRFVPHDNPPGSAVVFLGGTYERHWTARVARVLIEFYLQHWQWIIGIAVLISIAILKAPQIA